MVSEPSRQRSGTDERLERRIAQVRFAVVVQKRAAGHAIHELAIAMPRGPRKDAEDLVVGNVEATALVRVSVDADPRRAQ